MRDRHFMNCSSPISRCVEQPNDVEFRSLNCRVTPDPQGFTSSDNFYKQSCRSSNIAAPVTIFDRFTNQKRELLVVSTQGGLVIVETGTEKIIWKQVLQGANFTMMQIVPGAFQAFAHVFGVGGLNNDVFFVWRLEFATDKDIFFARLEATGTLPGPAQDMTTFFDIPSQSKYVAVSISGAQPRIVFLPVDTTTVTITQTWMLSNVPANSFVKIEMVQHLDIDKDAGLPNIQCFKATNAGQRSLIMITTNSAVYLYGFLNTNIGTQNLDLSPAATTGKTLFYQADTAGSITSAWAYGECFGDYALRSQQIWLAVATSNGLNTHLLNLVPLPEFAHVDMTCITDGSNWWTAPASRRNTGACTMATVCTSHTQYADANGACIPRPIPTVVALRNPAFDITSAQTTDSKTTTNAVELATTYMTTIFAVGANTVQIFGVQEAVCSATTTPVVSTLNYITYTSNIIKATISPNGQHLFATVERRDWEVDSHQRLAEICQDLWNNPLAGTYNARFREMCRNAPGPLSIYDFITYNSQCNGGWFCPQFGSIAFRSSESRTDTVVAPGQHVMRPTRTHVCEPGFFCPGQVDSYRRICPVGFKCPDNGMVTPVHCFTGNFYENGCLSEGQTTEILQCPPGNICKSGQKATPAPPGYLVGSANRKFVVKCSTGDLCTLGASNSSLLVKDSSYVCPGGFYCPSTDTMAPIPCKTMYNLAGTQKIFNLTEYCPPGTSGQFPHPCPPQFECPDLVTAKKCEDGYFCPVGTQFAESCPAGTYCPTPSAFLSCPRDFYCRNATQNPRPCQWLVWCPEGSTSEKYAFVALAVDLAIVVVIFFAFQCVRVVIAALRKKRKKKKFLGKNEGYGEALTALIMDEDEDDEIPQDDQELSERTDGVLERKNFTMDITLNGVNVTRLKTGKFMMRGISGRIYHNRTTVILGAKREDTSVFLDILSGRAYYARVDGRIKVNGNEEEDMSSFKNITGFVDRKDLMIPSFKVEENIRFAAHSRLPYMSTYSEISQRINSVLAVLQMEHLRNKHVGKKSEEFQGITAYQRKQTSVAMELVADPSILLLEHPFDNLSAGEAYQLLNNLKVVSRKGLTVVFACHKPRFEVFKEFDDVLLLGRNGETIYNGPVAGILRYFEEEGFKCEQFKNPADFVVDIVQGNVKRAGDQEFNVEQLVELWERKQQEIGKPWSVPDEDPLTQTELDAAPKNIMTAEEHLIHQMTSQEKNRNRPGFVAQFFQYWIRNSLELIRHVKGQLFDFFMYLILASLLGAVYFNMDFIGPPTTTLQQLCPAFVRDRLCAMPRLDRVGVTLALTSFALACLSMFSSFKIFGQDKNMYRKEVQNGINKGAFFLGKVVANLPLNFILPFVFIAVWYAFIVPRASFGAYYGLFVLIQCTWSAYGVLVSIAMKREHAGFYALLGLILAALLAGFTPTLKTFLDSGAFYAVFLMFVSPLTYAFQSLYLLEIETYRADNVDVSTALASFGIEIDNFYWIIIVQFIFCIVFYLFAFLVLYFKDPRAIESVKILFKSCYKKKTKEVKVMKDYKDPSLLEEFEDTDNEDDTTLMQEDKLNESLLGDDDKAQYELNDINKE